MTQTNEHAPNEICLIPPWLLVWDGQQALPISIFLALFFVFVSRVTMSLYLEDILQQQIYM
jgi:hypothetical protein